VPFLGVRSVAILLKNDAYTGNVSTSFGGSHDTGVLTHGVVLPHRIENLTRQNRKGGRLEVAVGHVSRHNFVILAHPLDHEIFDQLANA